MYKGLLDTICSVVGVVGGLYAASAYASTVGAMMGDWFELKEHQLYVIAYIVVFVGVALIVLIVTKIVEQFLKAMTLSWVNRLLGGLFGLLKYALIVSIVLNLLDVFHQRTGLLKETSESTQASMLYEPLRQFGPFVLPYFSVYVDQLNEKNGTEEVVE